jgi:hypothetical protein
MDDHRRPPTLHQLRDLVAGSRATSITATLRLHDDPAAQQVTITTQQSAEILRLPAGDYLFHAYGPRWAISTTDSEPLLRSDGQHTIVHCVKLSTPGDAAGSAVDDDRLILVAAAQPLIQRDPRIVDYLHERAERTAGSATVISARGSTHHPDHRPRTATRQPYHHHDGSAQRQPSPPDAHPSNRSDDPTQYHHREYSSAPTDNPDPAATAPPPHRKPH